MTRDDSHPTSDLEHGERRVYLIPEIYAAAEELELRSPYEILRLAERELDLMPHSLQRLGLLEGEQQQALLDRIQAICAERATEASDA